MFYRIVRAILKIITKLLFRVRVYGFQKIPQKGSLIICSNHSSMWDPVFISIIFPRQISWMGKKELFENSFLRFIFSKLTAFPVDRDGSDLGAIKNALRILKENRVLGMFPEGSRVKSLDLGNAKAGVPMLGYKGKALILPVYIESKYKVFSRVYISIGQPIDLSQEIEGRPSTDDYLDWSKKILTEIYDLKESIGV